MLFAANVWHWWISVPLVIGSVGAVAATFVGYFRKMNALKHPSRRTR
jgi:formate-dependent nitrite reductase membrane component NrfD